ncbi:hypothetical protein MGSAQ_000849 [marine sediment metagenome]|uniref:Uncharacterized protein n=1 Tax=marine sediment metagenome TaxID=412755 RepID=A0A1B6NW31_9ZZZZ
MIYSQTLKIYSNFQKNVFHHVTIVLLLKITLGAD